MKKIIISLLLAVSLSMPIFSSAQVVTLSPIDQQLADLKQQLIALLTQEIQKLQDQINTILAQQQSLNTVVQNQGQVIIQQQNSINQNIPVGESSPVNNPTVLSVTSNDSGYSAPPFVPISNFNLSNLSTTESINITSVDLLLTASPSISNFQNLFLTFGSKNSFNATNPLQSNEVITVNPSEVIPINSQELLQLKIVPLGSASFISESNETMQVGIVIHYIGSIDGIEGTTQEIQGPTINF